MYEVVEWQTCLNSVSDFVGLCSVVEHVCILDILKQPWMVLLSRISTSAKIVDTLGPVLKTNNLTCKVQAINYSGRMQAVLWALLLVNKQNDSNLRF